MESTPDMTVPLPIRPDSPGPASSAPPAIALPEGWTPASPEDRLPALLAYALTVEAGVPPRPAEAAPRKAEAARLLHDWAFRHLHNQVQDIRTDAEREALSRLRQPPGFLTLVAAGLVSTLITAGLAWGAVLAGLLTLPGLRN